MMRGGRWASSIASVVAVLTCSSSSSIAQTRGLEPLTPAQVVAKGGVPLTGPQIVARSVGNTTYSVRLKAAHNIPAGGFIAVFYRDAKTRVFRAPNGRLMEALWWIEGNQLCAEFKLERIAHVCGTIYQAPSGMYFCERNAPLCEWQIRMVPGNPENL